MMAPLKTARSFTSHSLREPVKLLATQESLSEIKTQTIPQFFHQNCQQFKDCPALAFEASPQGNKTWNTITYKEYEINVELAALALLYVGVEQRTSVCVLAFNSPEWFYIQFGALCINAIAAGIYTTNSAEAVLHVLSSSNASVVVVDDSHQMAKVREIRSHLPHLRAVVQLHGPFDFDEKEQQVGCYRWPDLMNLKFGKELRAELQLRERNVAPNECALLIYTSGTVGMPKGVMLSHDNMLFATYTADKMLNTLKQGLESTVSYLPLSHIGPQFFEIFLSIGKGALVYFADKNALKGTLVDAMVKAKPTWFFGVPRVFAKIQETLMQLESKCSEIEKGLRNTARLMMLQHYLDKMAGKPTSPVKYWLAENITNRMKQDLGLDHLKMCFAASAPMPKDLKLFFLSLNLPILEAYGLSETSAGVSYNFDIYNLRTCGKSISGIEVKLYNANAKGEGELLVRGRNVFMGYVNEAEKTAKAITPDGWFLTGDLAAIDAEGNIYIKGRIKEIIITDGGENIPPIRIEDLIKKELPCISNVMVVGDQRKYLTVLLTFKKM
ncbi:long-chain-fatty-acid--CoA ligase heimdall [Stomoxys calcitrans]|uniref:long-chain-fatty-acid--CoA ligase heimdall n=1 Tax=Stomoxys calcitrans TaxID=35570 RepID=UPI0027E3A92F|nr:long-chain-fatty-acid--CoA ligase heimdall [Stomoxys calcitrans]